MTVYTDNAARFATTDRAQRAEQTLNAAVREAIGILRLGRRTDDEAWARHDAARVLEVAGGSADRMLGRRSAS